MVSKKIIFLGLSLFGTVGYAQDSQKVKNESFIDRTSLYDVSLRRMNNLSSLKPSYFSQDYTSVQVGYDYSSKKNYDWQEGSGSQDFTFQSETYQILNNDITVWGNAHFKSIKLKGIRFNENLDYAQVYPYFLADSLGGDLIQESYYFGGGLAKRINKWTLGIEGYLTANQGYRQVDPRPLNKSTLIDLQGSLGRQLGDNYSLSMAIDYTFYKQTSRLSFVSLLGRPLIFNLNGPGAYNNLLTGMGPSGASNALAYYENNKLKFTFILSPKKSGLFSKWSIEQRTGEKFTNHSNESINFWTDEQLNIDLGYHKQLDSWYWHAMGAWNSRRMKGADGLFTTINSSGSGGYNKIADRSSYRYFSDSYQATLLVGSPSRWNTQLQVSYKENQEQYISPFRNMERPPLDISFSAQYFIKHKKNILETTVQIAKRTLTNQDFNFSNVNLSSEIGQLLANNWDYKVAKPIFADIQLQYLINLNNGIAPFVKLNAGYMSEVEQSKFALHLGINF